MHSGVYPWLSCQQILFERDERLARHLLRDGESCERKKRRCDIAERAGVHLLHAVGDHDERHRVRRVLRERLVRLVVPHLVRVAVIRRDADLAAHLADGIDKAPAQVSTVSTAFTTAGTTPVCPTMSQFA